MRAATALGLLIADPNIPEVRQSVEQCLEQGCAVLEEHVIVWFAVHPALRGLLLAKESMMDALKQRLPHCSYDLVILLMATVSDVAELEQLLSTQRDDGQVVEDFLFTMFGGAGHSMCSRWAALCLALEQVI